MPGTTAASRRFQGLRVGPWLDLCPRTGLENMTGMQLVDSLATSWSWFTIYTIVVFSYKYHEVLDSLYKEYGPVVKEDIGGRVLVHIFNPDDIKTVIWKSHIWRKIDYTKITLFRYTLLRENTPSYRL